MQVKRVLFSLMLTCLVAANCVAQDDAKEAKNKKAFDRAATNVMKQVTKSFGKVKLTDEQMTKAKEIVGKHVAKIQEARKASEGLLTAEQVEKRKSAFAKAKEEGVKGNKLWAAASDAMGLSKEEKKAYREAKQKVNKLTGVVKTEVVGLLTDEQKEALPKKKGKRGGKKKKEGEATEEGGKTQTVALKLPGMT